MSDEIAQIGPVRSAPAPAVVATLADALEAAKRGEIQAMVLVTDENPPHGRCVVGSGSPGAGDERMLGNLAIAQAALTQRLMADEG